MPQGDDERDQGRRATIGAAAGAVVVAVTSVVVTYIVNDDVTPVKVAVGVALTALGGLVGLGVTWWFIRPRPAKMSATLRATAAVLGPDGNPVGYAFAVTNNLVVTAPAVVNRALAREEGDTTAPEQPDAVTCLWPIAEDHPVDVQLVKWAVDDGLRDHTRSPAGYAVLRLAPEHSFPKAVSPSVLAIPTVPWAVDVEGAAADPERSIAGTVVRRLAGGSYREGKGEGETSGDLLGAPVVRRTGGNVLGVFSGNDGERFWFRHVTYDEATTGHAPMAVAAEDAPVDAQAAVGSTTPQLRLPQVLGGVLLAIVLVASLVACIVEGDGQQSDDCADGPVVLNVVSGTEKDGLIKQLANEYNADKSHCADITVYGVSSGDAAVGLAQGWLPEIPETRDQLEECPAGETTCSNAQAMRPDLWMPTSSEWARLLDDGELDASGAQDGDAGANASGARVLSEDWDESMTSVASSVLTILIPEDKVADLRPVSWENLVAQAATGTLSMALDDPIRSTSGMATSVALNEALALKHGDDVAGRVTELRNAIASVPDELVGDEITQLMADVYASLESSGSSADDLMSQMDAIVAQEQTAYLFNCRDPLGEGKLSCEDPLKGEGRLVSVMPEETYQFDHPAIQMASLDEDADKRDIAADFVEWLKRDKAAERFAAWGFRAAGDAEEPTEDLEDVVGAVATDEIADWPSAEDIQVWREEWTKIRKPVQVVLGVDNSGSMEDHTVHMPGFKDACTHQPLDDPTYMQLAQRAALAALGQLREGIDQVSLVPFPGDKGRESTPMSVFDQDVAADITVAVCAMKADGYTPLYDTVSNASTNIDSKGFDGTQATVVISDGVDDRRDVEGYESAARFEDLMKQLEREGAEPVYAVAIGEADVDALDKITTASNGALRDLSHGDAARQLESVLIDVFRGVS